MTPADLEWAKRAATEILTKNALELGGKLFKAKEQNPSPALWTLFCEHVDVTPEYAQELIGLYRWANQSPSMERVFDQVKLNWDKPTEGMSELLSLLSSVPRSK